MLLPFYISMISDHDNTAFKILHHMTIINRHLKDTLVALLTHKCLRTFEQTFDFELH